MKWFSVQISIAITCLIVATAGAWYEGSALIDNPWEWAYSTPFSQMIHGEILNAGQISQLDHFVYAAKFQPVLPLVMLICVVYIALLAAYRAFHQNLKQWITGLSLLSITFLFAGSAFAKAPTIGGSVFFYFFIAAGVLSMAGVILCYTLMNRHSPKEIIS